MHLTTILALATLVLASVISAAEVKNDAATPAPVSKLRSEINVVPPPHKLQAGERQLGILDWLFESPTAAPDTPAPAFNFGNKNYDDGGPFSGPFWDPNATF
ncbi:hypothetical protein F441_17723 [Phytophthora nicotianae CJ01A1]|uniref:RxLR effector protein n=4 Tax=Phytophthora nicotianae TaxID=4792 RepID=V9EA73_PHYNI|nr:hypothetical protein F443_17849 [Phytophthora nicotianae P1569]ETK76129.1 hypothetical protein L915_17372 [Phytophthora nicotianae]ETP05677.1 hypothetical protein F441_17723 [Phytophthora nicotianae CJ01A1]ETP33807.1 hypothetical protein F442_17704 [Phytophthora nicotianae P10297]ETL29575.1 hypothetical protein L916_17264 [Phytophthora nicotianae]